MARAKSLVERNRARRMRRALFQVAGAGLEPATFGL